MPNFLFLSKNTVFKEDVLNQIKLHAPDFECVDESFENPDIIVVDEDERCLEEVLKKDRKTPLIFLEKEESPAQMNGVEVIEKPFYLSRFLDSIKAAINIFENSQDGQLAFNRYILFPSKKEILNLRNNETTKLTEKEVSILKYLYKNSAKIVSKNDLMSEVWEYAADVATHTVETHIYRLRQKVEKDDPSAQIILTSEGGYQLVL